MKSFMYCNSNMFDIDGDIPKWITSSYNDGMIRKNEVGDSLLVNTSLGIVVTELGDVISLNGSGDLSVFKTKWDSCLS